MISTQVETDVVVIGGGGSGLAAAIEARSLGRRVILLERNPQLGGTTSRSIGSITATNTPHQLKKGIRDSPADHFEDMARFAAASRRVQESRYRIDDNTELPAVSSRMCPTRSGGSCPRVWNSTALSAGGPAPQAAHAQRPAELARLHLPPGTGRAKAGVRIVTSVRAKRLLLEEGNVVGVACDERRPGRVSSARRGGVDDRRLQRRSGNAHGASRGGLRGSSAGQPDQYRGRT
jgi:choline dehydrogenase-like flavoprotein